MTNRVHKKKKEGQRKKRHFNDGCNKRKMERGNFRR